MNYLEDTNLRPIVFDLDNTFAKVDVFWELALSLAVSRPLKFLDALVRARSRLELKRLVFASRANRAPIPVNPDVEKIYREARNNGRTTILATASIPEIASEFASQVGGFDRVLSSVGGNLKGSAKAEVLLETFGESGFDYVGDSRADIPVWDVAATGHFVGRQGAKRSIERQIGKPLALVSRSLDFRAVLRSLRIEHWPKNSLIFVAPLLAMKLGLDTFWNLVPPFFGFCLIASSLYIINDIGDLWSDRLHPHKSQRPIASGELDIRTGVLISAMLLSSGLSLISVSSGLLGMFLGLVYAFGSLSYSTFFKRFPLLDVTVLSSLYMVRVIVGAVLGDTLVSYWLVLLAFLTFLSLGLVKRSVEIDSLGTSTQDENSSLTRRGYTRLDASWVSTAGVSSGVATVLVLALYVQNKFALLGALDSLSVVLVPLWGIWILSFWRDAARRKILYDPVKYALTHPPLIALAAFMVLIYFVSSSL